MMHIVFVGNPGSGKSTILNSCVGRIISSSGPAISFVHKRKFHSHRIGNVVYSDTPGLDDVRYKKYNAEVLSGIITRHNSLKLILVIVLEAGRVRCSDLCMMKLILDSIQKQGIDTSFKYSLIINRLGGRNYSIYKSEKNMSILLETFSKLSPLNNILLLKLDESAYDECDSILAEAEEVKKFVDAAPTITDDSLQNITIDISEWVYTYEKLKELQEVNEKFVIS